MFTVYILYSPSYNKTYVGYTSNLEQRLLSHNELGTKGWTIKFRPWDLIYTEVFDTKEAALFREKQLKAAKGRDWIQNELFSNCNSPGSYPPPADGGSIPSLATKKMIKASF